MRNKPIAIVLAGTVPHIALIESLKARGYYTMLVDYYENPPAKAAADEHIRESTLDQETVLNIAKDADVDLVISTCMEHANVTACYVAEKLGLPAPYSYQTALNVTNKGLMKKRMLANGIPTSKYIYAKDLSKFEQSGLNFPVVVKPTDSNGSKGVRKACDHGELSLYLEDAIKVSRSDQAIIEEFVEGREIGVDCFIKNKKATILITKERRKIEGGGDSIQQIKGCIWPAVLSEIQLSNLEAIAEQIAQVFDLDNSPLMIQAIVNGNQVSIIEFAARFGGGESFRIIKLSTGFDIIESSIDSFLGVPVHLELKPVSDYYADNFIYARAGMFGGIKGKERLLKDKTVEYVDTYKTIGMEIGTSLTSNNRIGVFTVKADNIDGLLKKMETVINEIEVLDINGTSIMRKELYAC